MLWLTPLTAANAALSVEAYSALQQVQRAHAYTQNRRGQPTRKRTHTRNQLARCCAHRHISAQRNAIVPQSASSAPGLGSPLPHLHRDWAHPCHICTGTECPHADLH